MTDDYTSFPRTFGQQIARLRLHTTQKACPGSKHVQEGEFDRKQLIVRRKQGMKVST